MIDKFLDLKNTKARVISVGIDEMSDYDFEAIPSCVTVVVYSYTSEPYEGWGIALCKNDSQLWTYVSLSHCSCYGPMERAFDYPNVWSSLEDTWNSITDKSEQNISVFTKAKEFIN